jgi:hypothetical protein
MLTYVQWRIELVTILLYTQVVITFFAIQTLFRLYSGSTKGLLRLYSGSIQALFRLYQGRILPYTQACVFVSKAL